MIKTDKRNAIFLLHEEGHSDRKIARLLDVNRKTVSKILKKVEESASDSRKGKIVIDEEILRREYKNCNGYLERLHEILTEDYEYKIGYSTLTLRVRELGLGKKTTSRSCHVEDVPGDDYVH